MCDARRGFPRATAPPRLLVYSASLPRTYPRPVRAPQCKRGPRSSAGQKPSWRVMETYATADLAAQLGDLALNTRVEIHDLDRPDLNGR